MSKPAHAAHVYVGGGESPRMRPMCGGGMARVWSRRHGHRREERPLSFCLRGPRGRACIESALDDDAFRLRGCDDDGLVLEVARGRAAAAALHRVSAPRRGVGARRQLLLQRRGAMEGEMRGEMGEERWAREMGGWRREVRIDGRRDGRREERQERWKHRWERRERGGRGGTRPPAGTTSPCGSCARRGA